MFSARLMLIQKWSILLSYERSSQISHENRTLCFALDVTSGLVAFFARPVHPAHQEGRQAGGARPLPQLR